MAFQKFQNVGGKHVTDISINKSENIGFPQGFCTEEKVRDFQYAELFFDRERRAIGVHFTNTRSPRSTFKIAKSGQYGAAINARSFLRRSGIVLDNAVGRYPWKKEREDEAVLYVFTLRENAVRNVDSE